jgi:hypothetical protein
MQVTPAQLRQVATDVRTVEAALTKLVGELGSAGVWSGPDADRFQDEWSSLVRSRILSAASVIDSAEFLSL